MNLMFAMLSLANVKYMLQGDYFGISEDAQPFLHYWSLSVEEQFYVVVPLALLILYAKLRMERTVWVLLLVSIVASFVGCVAMTQWRHSWAFYLLPTRAWELAFGAFLAFRRTDLAPRFLRDHRAALGPIGLVMVVVSFFVVTNSTYFPGPMALLPVLGTALIIAVPPRADAPSERWLAHPALVSIGKLSYSLYLWHWPVYSLVNYELYDKPMWLRLALKLVLTFALSIGSFYLIEGPTRRFLNKDNRRWLCIAGALVVIGACSVLGYSIRRYVHPNVKVEQLASGGIEAFPRTEKGDIALLGDSHMVMYQTTIRELARELGYGLTFMGVDARSPMPEKPNYPEATVQWNLAMEGLDKVRHDVVFYTIRWDLKYREFDHILRKALDDLLARTDRVILTLQPPVMPEEITRDTIRAGERPPFFENQEQRDLRERAAAMLRSFESDRVLIVEATPLFFNEDGSIRDKAPNGRYLYHDDDHPSSDGARLVKPLFREAIEEAFSRPEPAPDAGDIEAEPSTHDDE